MLVTISQRVYFDAAHRLLDAEDGEQYLHGHRFCANLDIEVPFNGATACAAAGIQIGEWVGKWWDHNIILAPEDPLAALWDFEQHTGVSGELSVFAGKKPYIMPPQFAEPSAENLCVWLSHIATAILEHRARVTRVCLWETPDHFAEYPAQGK